eukprot:16814-Chlamydomonas_euryale.AAC.1
MRTQGEVIAGEDARGGAALTYTLRLWYFLVGRVEHVACAMRARRARAAEVWNPAIWGWDAR